MRTLIFIALSLAGFLPIAHLLISKGFSFCLNQLYFGNMMLMGFFYFIGAIMFGFRFPECVLPSGYVDLIGNGHNFHHTTVVIATSILGMLLEKIAKLQYEAQQNGLMCLDI